MKIDILKNMIGNEPKNASAWFLLGLEYTEKGERGEALLAFTQALAYGDEGLKDQIVIELNKLSTQMPKRSSGKANDGGTRIQAPVKSSVTMRVIEGGKNKKGESQVTVLDKKVRFLDVGGLHDVKEAIRMKMVQPFLTPDLYDRYGIRAGGGVLLYGPPGCGKTFLGKATAGECQAKLFQVQVADILHTHVGASEQNIRALFDSARQQKPAVLFLDEMDAIGYHRGKASSPWMRGIIDQLLSEMDRASMRADQLLVMGATNMPWDVDPAFHRPGRFEKMVFVGPPDRAARETIFQLKLDGRPVEPLDYAQLAAWTELYSGADIEYVVELATEQVLHDILAKGTERPIRMSDLRESIAATRPTTIEWLRTAKNYVKYANDEGLYDGVEHFLAEQKRI
ncbi:ATP-binding protein [Brevibacillus nitrificans]|uniref:ATP-binding protein n=1 Tax=Brevibacillus nitrificans TaxID=651560 RepID=UPI002E2310D3|nr:ATP-binding protein [Brevibacillus nitrificans]